METKTDVQVGSQTKTAVGLSIGMIAAFCVGLSFALFLAQAVKPSTPSAPIRPLPMILSDIDYAQLSNGLPGQSTQSWHQVTFTGLTTTGPSNVRFGVYNSDTTHYVDGQSSRTDLPLMVQVDVPNHQAMVITLQVKSSQGELAKALPGVKTAKAQVNTDIKKPICLPKKTTIDPVKYFIDSRGNAYYDQYLTKIVNKEDCRHYIDRTYSPDDITGMRINWPFTLPTGGTLNLAKSWEIILGTYDPSTGFIDGQTDGLISAEAPLFITGGNNTNADIGIPANTFVLNTNLGTTTLCFPEIKVQPNTFFVYFYDVNGTPYGDIDLQQPLITSACNQLLANSYNPTAIASGMFNQPYDNDLFQNQSVALGFFRDNAQIGDYDLHNPGAVIPNTPTNPPSPDSRSPLYIKFWRPINSDSPITLPANTVSVTTNLGTHTLCVPETSIPVYDPAQPDNFLGRTYYYNTAGTPFSDALLNHPIACSR